MAKHCRDPEHAKEAHQQPNDGEEYDDDIVTLDVGGRLFRIHRRLLPQRVFPPASSKRRRLSPSQHSSHASASQTPVLFFDRDPAVFEDVLRYLRTGVLQCTPGVDLRIVTQEWENWGVFPTQEFHTAYETEDHKSDNPSVQQPVNQLATLTELRCKVDVFLDELLAPQVVKQWHAFDGVHAHQSSLSRLPLRGPSIAPGGHTTSLALLPHTTARPLQLHFGMTPWNRGFTLESEIDRARRWCDKFKHKFTLNMLPPDVQAYYRLALHDSIQKGEIPQWPKEHNHWLCPTDVDGQAHEIIESILKQATVYDNQYARKLERDFHQWLLHPHVQRMIVLRLAQRGWIAQFHLLRGMSCGAMVAFSDGEDDTCTASYCLPSFGLIEPDIPYCQRKEARKYDDDTSVDRCCFCKVCGDTSVEDDGDFADVPRCKGVHHHQLFFLSLSR